MASSRTSGQRRATRQLILDVAQELFATQGYTGTSVREIAGRVGVTVPALYYHFQTKDEILRTLLGPLLEGGEDLLSELSLRCREDPGFSRAALEAYFDLVIEHVEAYELISSDPAVRRHPDVGPTVRRQVTAYLDMIVGPRPDHAARVRATAALGALRRPLDESDFDPTVDRATVIAAALGALRESTGIVNGSR